jgi:RNA polymerase sigma-70 factor, ECF subfamily
MDPDQLRHQEFELQALPHGNNLLRAAIRLTGDRSLAEDMVQETLLLAWRSFHQFDVRTNCKAWLFRIMLNLLSKHHRRLRARPPELSLNEELTRDTASTGAPFLLRTQVLATLERLSGEYRTVLLLGVVEGFTCREIAGILGIPIGTVMSRLSRARAAFRDALTGHDRCPVFPGPQKQRVSKEVQ